MGSGCIREGRVVQERGGSGCRIRDGTRCRGGDVSGYVDRVALKLEEGLLNGPQS